MTEQLLPTNNTQSSRDSSLAIDSQDRVHVLVHAWTQNDVYYAVLKDGAWTAQWIEQFPDVGKPVALALDASGRPFATYKDKGAALNRLAVLKDDGTWLLSTLIPGCDGDESHGIAIAADRWDIMTAACHIPTGGIQWTTGQFFGPIQGITSSLPAPF
jgi:hypothetical protein